MSGTTGDWAARLRLDPTAFVAPGAVVVGDVTLGPRASVWFNAVVRADSAPVEIGEDSNLQDLCVVHEDEGLPARIGARVTIGHRAVIHGCVIEDECLIGMGSILLSGARIGTGSLIGAGALVRERQVVPPGSVVLGMPGKVVGEVTPAQREGTRGSAVHYAALARSYLERGFARPHPHPGSDTGITSRERGVPGAVEWDRLVTVLAESPAWVARRLDRYGDARWAAVPATGGGSARDLLGGLLELDRDEAGPRLERMLTEDRPVIPNPDPRLFDTVFRTPPDRSPRGIHLAWSVSRRTLVARLVPLTPADWGRMGWYSDRGAFLLGGMVREWAERDLLVRREIARALGEFA